MSKFLIVCCFALIVAATSAGTPENLNPNTFEVDQSRCIESINAMYQALVKQARDDVNNKEYKDEENIRIDAEVLRDVETSGSTTFNNIIETVKGLKEMGAIEENYYLDGSPLFCDEDITVRVFSITEKLLRLDPEYDS